MIQTKRLALLTVLMTSAFSLDLASQETSDSILQEYVSADDPSFGWDVKQSFETEQGSITELIMTSQTWRGLVWRHQLFVIKPNELDENRDSALLVIGGGSWRDELAEVESDVPSRRVTPYLAIAEQLQSIVVVVLQVPHQPLFDDRHEDELIAFTFQQFILTGESDWPLLMPMVKSAVAAMDASEQFLQENWEINISSYTVTGASKRGWTTWLTSAVDDRVGSLAPMVIDVVNMGPQMRHQREVWGAYSEEIGDYTERGLQQILELEPGKALRRIVDPYHYIDQIDQPKLIYIGTNDRYWPIDALNFYWDDLVGEKHIIYVPNNGHGLQDMQRILGGLNALHLHTCKEIELPKWQWDFENQGDALALTMQTMEPPESISIWYAESEQRDFREVRWHQEPLTSESDEPIGYIRDRSPDKYIAFFGEVEFVRGGLPVFLSTNVRVLMPLDGER